MINFTLSLRLLALLPLVALSVHAENDWNTPCLNGVCQYSLSGTNSGTVKIWGSPDAITDITNAAGWEILNCSSDALAQDIRLVCKGDENSESSCAHLYQNIGAEGKIVRLPENCGQSAFARIAKAWVSEDQSIPAKVAKRLVRRDGAPAIVKALRLDTDFAAADQWKKVGPVNIAIQGANFAGVDAKGIMKTAGPQRRARLSRRDNNEFLDGAIEGIKKKAEEVKDKAGEVVDTAKDKAGEVVDKAGDVAGKVKDKAGEVLDKAKDVNVNKTIDLPPFSLTKSANLLNKRISCPPADAGINVDISSTGTARVSLGVAAIGSLVPPKFDEFQIISGLDADIDGTLTMTGDASGFLDSGRIKIFEIGVPGLSIPGILSVGPTFSINAQASAQLDVNVDMTVGFVYQINDAQLFFPDKAKKSGGKFQIGDTPLTLSSAANGQANGLVEAHLVPGINFGITALNNIATAQIFLDADASATLNMNFDASGDKTQGAEATKTAGGCVDMNAGLNVAAGARGSLFNIFNDQTQVPLFNKKFPLFKKCFGDKNTNSTATAEGETTAGDETTAEDDTTATGEETTAEDDTTAGDETTAEDDTTATGEETDTTAGDETTAEDDTTAEDETTAEDDTTAAGEETTAEDDTTAEDETTTEDDTTAAGEETTAEDDTTAGDETTTEDDTTAAGEETTAEDDTTAEDETTTEDDTTAAGEETTAGDETTAEDDTTAEETTADDETTADGETTEAETEAEAPVRRSRIMGRQAKDEKKPADPKAPATPPPKAPATPKTPPPADPKTPPPANPKTPAPPKAPAQKKQGAASEALQCLKNSIKPTVLTKGKISKSQIKAV